MKNSFANIVPNLGTNTKQNFVNTNYWKYDSQILESA